jgi:hypothetical protein
MRKTLTIGIAASLLVSGAVALTAGRSAAAEERQRCHRVHGGIRASVVAQGCTSPVGLCTAGEFHGDGLLNGTTSLTADGIVPAAGMPAVEAPTTLSYSGLLTITTPHGTLTTRDTGIFDTAGIGLFASRDVIVAGTGIFAGATGHIFYTGTGTTSFDADASGEICLAH